MRQATDVNRTKIDIAQLPDLIQIGYHDQAQQVCFAFFDYMVEVFERFLDQSVVRNGSPEAKTMCNLVKHDEGKIRVKRHVVALISRNQQVCNRSDELLKLCLHSVLEQQGSRTCS